jgi:hypothetical protein
MRKLLNVFHNVKLLGTVSFAEYIIRSIPINSYLSFYVGSFSSFILKPRIVWREIGKIRKLFCVPSCKVGLEQFQNISSNNNGRYVQHFIKSNQLEQRIKFIGFLPLNCDFLFSKITSFFSSKKRCKHMTTRICGRNCFIESSWI